MPQDQNRYAYVVNNLMAYPDPTGHIAPLIAYRIREERPDKLVRRVHEAEGSFSGVTHEHRPRRTGHLRRADALANEALDRG